MDLAFQLTPSRRATIAGVYGMFSVRNFNSRPHGGRHGLMLSGFSACLFQLTPSRRATTYVAAVLSMSIFQLTPSRRATRFVSSENPQSIFQLTPSRRATVTWVPILCSQIFQLTPSRRATRTEIENIGGYSISTHALTEGDHSVSQP